MATTTATRRPSRWDLLTRQSDYWLTVYRRTWRGSTPPATAWTDAVDSVRPVDDGTGGVIRPGSGP